MMTANRWRNGSSPRISGPINGRQPSGSSRSYYSYPALLLLKKCIDHPRGARALFVAILLSWVGFVAVFLYRLPRHPDYDDNDGMISPLSARDNLFRRPRRAPPSSHAIIANSIIESPSESSGGVRSNRREISRGWIASYLVSNIPEFAAISPNRDGGPLHKEKVGVSSHPDDANAISRKEKHYPVRTERKHSKSNRQSSHNRIANVIMPMMPFFIRNTASAEEKVPKLTSVPTYDDAADDPPKDAASFQPHHRLQKSRMSTKDQIAIESIRQSTRDALVSSEPNAQIPTDVSAARHVRGTSAFVAGEYFHSISSMGSDDDSLDTYYAADDDMIRGSGYTKRPDGHEPICRTPSFYRLYRPTCNELHAVASGYQWLTGGFSHYLGSGAYRQVFVLERQFGHNSEEVVVLKSMKRFPTGNGNLEKRAAYNPEDTYHDIELYDDMRKDSMVMELLTSSNRIANIYSFCATSSLVEYAPGNIEKYVMADHEIDGGNISIPMNNIGAGEKLEMSLEMAKGIAAMHGHSGGAIANVDVQIGQFSRGKDGLIKIIDFNRAEAMLFDEVGEEYCKFENGNPPDGSLRSPEEVEGSPLDEKIDVYSLGNVFYSILTGLLVNRDYTISQAHSRIRNGITEEIDVGFFESRSSAELALVKVIQWCWEFDAEKRPSIFEIVDFLDEEVNKLNYIN